MALERGGKATLAVIAHPPGDVRHAQAGGLEQLRGILHPVLADMRGDRRPVHLLERIFQGGGVHQILPGQGVDGTALLQTADQLLVDLTDDLRLLGPVLRHVLFPARLHTAQHQEELQDLHAPPGRPGLLRRAVEGLKNGLEDLVAHQDRPHPLPTELLP